MAVNAQRYSSADTSLAVVNRVYTQREWRPGSRVLDYGGGRYDLNVEFMRGKGVEVAVYDKFNRTPEHNTQVLQAAREVAPDYVVCSNVLNVIMEDDVVDGILQDMASYGAPVLIAVYEGNRSGVGAETTKGYQRNARLADYVPMVQKHYDIVSKKAGILECLPR